VSLLWWSVSIIGHLCTAFSTPHQGDGTRLFRRPTKSASGESAFVMERYAPVCNVIRLTRQSLALTFIFISPPFARTSQKVPQKSLNTHPRPSPIRRCCTPRTFSFISFILLSLLSHPTSKLVLSYRPHRQHQHTSHI
jgi:hypothetical protein